MTDQTRASLELLYNISRQLAGALDLHSVLKNILSLSLSNVGAERGTIVVLDDRGQPVDVAGIHETREINFTPQQLRETVERGLAGWVIQNQKPALLPDTSRDRRWLRRPDDAMERSGAKSAICVPLMARERLVGVLTVVHPQPGFFSLDHLLLMQAIADQSGSAVLNSRLYDESQRKARVMTALAEGAVALNASLRQEEVLQRILDQTNHALQTEVALLALIDDTHQELVFRAATGSQAQHLIGDSIPLNRGVVGRVAADGRGVIVHSVPARSADQLTGLEVHALLCAPVHAHGHILGVLEVINPPPSSLTSEALLVLTGIGSLAGVAINNSQLYERVEATNRRYRELFEDSIDPILITDWRGRIQEANRQAQQMTGYDGATLLKMSISDLHQVNRAKLGDNYGRLTQSGTISYESQLRTNKGNQIPIEIHVHRAQLDSSDYIQWILRDISERKKLATLQDDMIAMVYHDLRSPMANIVSSLELLNNMLPQQDHSLTSVLAIANRSTERMQRLVSSLLDIRRLEAGQAISNQELIAPQTLIHDAVEAVRMMADGKQQSIKTEVPEELPSLWVDPDMIRRVLINLLENASKYTPSGGKLGIGAQRVGPYLQMWIEDTGPGIPQADQERIFEKFTRLTSPNAPKGLGLGLAFCKLAVQAHGGQIWVESHQDIGSRFAFNLPVAEHR
ncbi:MAG TPA: GAF domain-containing protein [Anaerolineaceae bacterium]|nr:GAF domain-containing protein [Anaerolineaceae bacterium]HPN51907.1 GAF domain-containing protein [Anaerolineaceae bacterium]